MRRSAPPAPPGDVAVRAGRFVAFDHDFEIHVDDPSLAAYLRQVLAPFARPGPGATRYLLGRVDGGYALWFEHRPLTQHGDPRHAVAMFLWHVNHQVVERTEDLVLLHAAGAARDGLAVLLPAPMEAGKTTLVAGLVRSGFDYLSDEIVAVDPATLEFRAYPKALSLDRGSWEVVPELAPSVDRRVRGFLPEQWQVPAEDIRPGSRADRATPALVIAPRYAPRAETRLTPLEPAAALVLLMDATFGFEHRADERLPVLGRLVERCPCFELVSGDLAAACAAVDGAFMSLRARAGG